MSEDRNVIYVEDDSSLADIISQFIELEGFVPRVAEDIQRAVGLFEQFRGNISGLISDCDLPLVANAKGVTEGSVIKLISYVLDNGIYVPTLLTSGCSYKHLADLVGVEFVTKDPDELKRVTGNQKITYPIHLMERFVDAVGAGRVMKKPVNYHIHGLSNQ